MKHAKPQERLADRQVGDRCGKAMLSHAEAAESARRIRRRNKNRGDNYPLDVYRCDGPDGCGWWHVGHIRAAKLVARKRRRRRAMTPRPNSGWRPPTSDGYERLGLTPPPTVDATTTPG